MTCKDCLHVDVCYLIEHYGADIDEEYADKDCENFKDRSRFVEIPCRVGDTVYVMNSLWVSEYTIEEIAYDGIFWRFYCKNDDYAIECRSFMFFNERIGKTVFLTRAEAEAKLKEMER